MGQYTTQALSEQDYYRVLETLENGFIANDGTKVKSCEWIAAALKLEANLGMRISDILQFKLSDIVKTDYGMKLHVIEQKTGKLQNYAVSKQIYDFIRLYCIDHNIDADTVIFKHTTREVQKKLKQCADYLGMKNVSTHSFRKLFATKMYYDNDKDIVLVQRLLNHSSSTTTQRYIGISEERINKATENFSLL